MQRLLAFFLWVFFLWLPLYGARIVPDRYIVELSGEPVAVHVTRQQVRAGMRSAAAQQRRAQIREEHRRLRAQAEQNEAKVLGGIETVGNALLVRIPEARAARLMRLPGVVRVRRVREFKMLLDRALPLHSVPDAWGQIGREQAGAGAKIAIIDSGIDATHPGFQAAGLSMPEGFPKVNAESDLAFTNAKVIVARSYASLFTRRETDSSARDRVGHGTALAMAAAGVLNAGPLATIAGVAPAAYVGNYKVFGSPGVNDGATEDAILKAIDDAVADGMDVINLSLGSDLASRPEDDMIVRAVERATAVGVLVIVAAGNNGPDLNTIGSPATAPSAIAVGASGSDRDFAASAVVGAQTYIAIPGSGPAPAEAIRAQLQDVAPLDGNGLACGSLPGGSLTGRIALILRGVCLFEEKLNNAQSAGAVAALVYTDAERPDPIAIGVGAATLPAEMVSYQDGVAIKQLLVAQPLMDAILRFALGPIAISPDRLAGFSSRGPNVDLTIKPELVAVGTSIYTATQSFDPRGAMYAASGYILEDGTSFSAPIVAGAAALLKSARPGLTVAEYRSLLVNSSAPISVQAGDPARVQQAGAGVLNVSAALRATAAASATAVNFGAGGPDPEMSRNLTISNTGTAEDTFSLETVPRGGGPAPTLSTTILNLAPRAAANLRVAFSGTALQPGPYEGFLIIRGTASGVETRIPYWYAVTSTVPRRITLLQTAAGGRRGAVVNEAAIFRVTDVSGVPMSGLSPVAEVVSGGGQVLDVVSRGDLSPGAYELNVRLGRQSGTNVFRIQAGEITSELTIAGR